MRIQRVQRLHIIFAQIGVSTSFFASFVALDGEILNSIILPLRYLSLLPTRNALFRFFFSVIFRFHSFYMGNEIHFPRSNFSLILPCFRDPKD